jgi:hypothetical protein
MLTETKVNVRIKNDKIFISILGQQEAEISWETAIAISKSLEVAVTTILTEKITS